MHDDTPGAARSPLSAAEIRTRRRQAEIRQILLRRLPLITYESFLQRLAGLRRHHPASAGVTAGLLRRAACIRLTRDLELARVLEEEYLAHLSAQGLEETWYNCRGDETTLLNQHLQAISQAVEHKGKATLVRLHRAEEN